MRDWVKVEKIPGREKTKKRAKEEIWSWSVWHVYALRRLFCQSCQYSGLEDSGLLHWVPYLLIWDFYVQRVRQRSTRCCRWTRRFEGWFVFMPLDMKFMCPFVDVWHAKCQNWPRLWHSHRHVLFISRLLLLRTPILAHWQAINFFFFLQKKQNNKKLNSQINFLECLQET